MEKVQIVRMKLVVVALTIPILSMNVFFLPKEIYEEINALLAKF